MQNNNLKYIDSMRGIAILMVLVVHSQMFMNIYNIKELPFNLENFIKIGHHGVTLFFIVSGYTLFRSFYNRKEIGYGNYFIRRFFRIAPLYYIILFILFYFQEKISFENLITHIFFVNGFFVNYYNSIIHVEWTIFVEIFFYLCLPLIYIYKDSLLNLSILFILISVTSLIIGSIFLNNSEYKALLAFSPIRWFFVFIIGGLIFEYGNSDRIKKFFVDNNNKILCILLILICILAYLRLPGDYILFVPILTFLFLLNKYNYIKIFNNSLFEYFGKISFSIYLIHMPLFTYIGNSEFISIIKFNSNIFNYFTITFIAIIIIIILSEITFYLIEKPFINFGKKLITFRKVSN